MSCWMLLFIFIMEISSTTISYEPLWTYEDESKWPGRKCQEGGRRQSPIDIKTADIIKDFNKDFIKYGPLQFVGYQAVLVTGINNGHTVQFSTEGDTSMYPTLTGGPLQHEYRLEQVHFHWVSEHSINGFKYPMEIHFVHVRSNLTVKEALRKHDGLAIVALFCNVQSELEESRTMVTEQIMEQIPELMEVGDRNSGIILDLTKLLSPSDNYYTYAGSLTSPRCNEAVMWILFKTPILFSDEQYRIFSKLGGGRHNFRSLQPIDQHQVFAPPYMNNHKPAIVVFFENVLTSVTEFFHNVNNMFRRIIR